MILYNEFSLQTEDNLLREQHNLLVIFRIVIKH